MLNCFTMQKYLTNKNFLLLFGMLRLSLSLSAPSLTSPGSAIVTYSKSSDPTSNGSTSRELLKNRSAKKILKKLVLIPISLMYFLPDIQ